MKNKPIWIVFWALVLVFVIVVTMIFTVGDLLVGEENPTPLGVIFIFSAEAALIGLGVTLLILTARAKVGGC